MPKLCERCFPNFEVVRSDEVSLDFPPLVRGVEATPFGVSWLSKHSPQSLFCRRLLILLSCRRGVEEDKDTALAVSDTNDSAGCVWVRIGRSGPVTAGSLA
jgi:hypothetical protein